MGLRSGLRRRVRNLGVVTAAAVMAGAAAIAFAGPAAAAELVTNGGFETASLSVEDGSQLVAWANSNHIGLLAFWSVAYQFTNIFKSFTG